MTEVRWNQEVADNLAAQRFYVRRRQVMQTTTLHHQPGVEVHLLDRGRARVVVAGQAYEHRPGRVLVFDAGQAHRVTSTLAEPFERTVVCISPELVERYRLGRVLTEGGVRELRPGRTVRERLVRLSDELHNEQTLRGLAWRRMSLALVAELSVLLRRQAKSPMATPGADDEAVSDLVRLACAHVRERLEETLTLEAVAGAFRVSEEHLTRSFRAELGVPFAKFVLHQRIEEARRLLQETGLSVTEIAIRTGFGSPSAFSRAFRRVTGLSPRAFRDRPSARP